jgi:hypothetical protein
VTGTHKYWPVLTHCHSALIINHSRTLIAGRDYMLIRAAGPEDADFIGEIRVAAWKLAYRGFMPDAFLDALNAAAHATKPTHR